MEYMFLAGYVALTGKETSQWESHFLKRKHDNSNLYIFIKATLISFRTEMYSKKYNKKESKRSHSLSEQSRQLLLLANMDE